MRGRFAGQDGFANKVLADGTFCSAGAASAQWEAVIGGGLRSRGWMQLRPHHKTPTAPLILSPLPAAFTALAWSLPGRSSG